MKKNTQPLSGRQAIHNNSMRGSMTGTINGIWLTPRGGKLHPAIQTNLSSCVDGAARSGFQVILWTSRENLQKAEIGSLEAKGVLVQDHTLCTPSRFYRYFLFFLKKAEKGDKVAFALASDILRIAILELVKPGEYYIYADPNDIKLIDVETSLSEKLPRLECENPWGFSFYIKKMPGGRVQKRNDVLIALKTVNSLFFDDYFQAYAHHLSDQAGLYNLKAHRDPENLARKISNSTASPLFLIQLSSENDKILAGFDPEYIALFPEIHIEAYITYEPDRDNGTTWSRPSI